MTTLIETTPKMDLEIWLADKTHQLKSMSYP